MQKTAYCQACAAWVHVKEDECCPNGHPRSQLRALTVMDDQHQPVVAVARSHEAAAEHHERPATPPVGKTEEPVERAEKSQQARGPRYRFVPWGFLPSLLGAITAAVALLNAALGLPMLLFAGAFNVSSSDIGPALIGMETASLIALYCALCAIGVIRARTAFAYWAGNFGLAATIATWGWYGASLPASDYTPFTQLPVLMFVVSLMMTITLLVDRIPTGRA